MPDLFRSVARVIARGGPAAFARGGQFRKTAFGAACISAQPILLNIISVPVLAYIIRRLGATGYGQWSTALGLISTVAILTSLGLRGIFIREVARRPEAVAPMFAEQLGTRLCLTMLAAAAAIIACLVLHYPVRVLECTLLATAGMFFMTISSTIVDVLQAFERLATVAFANLIGGLALTAVSALTVFFSTNPVSVALAYLTGPILSVVFFLVLLRRARIPLGFHLNPRKTARVLWRARYFIAQSILGALNTNAPFLLLPKLIGSADFGIFSAGSILVTRLAILPDGIGTALYPVIARSHQVSSRSAGRKTLIGTFFTFLLCLIVATAGFVFAPWIARILFPHTAAACQRVIRITTFALPLIGVEMLMGSSINASGGESAQARASVGATILSLIVAAILIVMGGLIGACFFFGVRSAIQIAFLTPEFIRRALLPALREHTPTPHPAQPVPP